MGKLGKKLEGVVEIREEMKSFFENRFKEEIKNRHPKWYRFCYHVYRGEE